MSGEVMQFPKTVEEFMEEYKVVDTEHVYTNGTELVPIFRMEQWFEHIGAESIKIGHWIEKGTGVAECDVCHQQNLYRQDGVGVLTKYCPSCGARMEW